MKLDTKRVAAHASVLIALTLCALVPSAMCETIFETGFEGPEYATGQLQGQNGWFNSTIPIVESAFANGGSQAVEVSALGQSGQSGAAHSISYDLVANNTLSATYTVDIMISQLAGAVNWYGAAIYGDSGFINQVIVIGGTGEVRLAGFGSGVTMAPGTWYQLELELDFVNGSTSAYLDGVDLGTQAFVNSPSTSLTYILAAGISNTTGANASIYYDNVRLTAENAVPEPSTYALLGFPLLAMGLWRRRRRAHGGQLNRA